MEKELLQQDEQNQTQKIKKVFKEIYFDDFDDPCEDFTDALYDLIPPDLIGNELKKLKGVKLKHGKFYSVEKIKSKK